MAFTMEVPDVAAIKKEEEEAQLRAIAENNVAEIMTLDIEEYAKRRIISQGIELLGAETMKLSEAENSLLQVTIGKLSKDGDEGGSVAKSLVDLQREFRRLDPSPLYFKKTGILGKLLDQIMDYYARYQKANDVIVKITDSLERGRRTLKDDNTTLELEQQAMRILTKKLKNEIRLAILMIEEIEKEIEAAKARNEDQEKIIFVTDEVLSPLQQRLMDIQTMIVVNQQGVMTTEIVIRINKELMRGVERAKNVTIPAFRNSVMVASALYNQKIVLEKIKKLNNFTEEIIIDNAEKLKEHGPEIQRLAMEATISVEKLKTAHDNVMEAIDLTIQYRREALPKIRIIIEELIKLTAKGEEQIQKQEKGQKIRAIAG